MALTGSAPLIESMIGRLRKKTARYAREEGR
jgi:hypothetical protein